MHKAARKENEYAENRVVAEILAKDGAHVKMLPIHQGDGWKSPDYLVDAVVWELESPREGKDRNIDAAVRHGSKQAANLIIHLPVNTDMSLARTTIKSRITRTDFTRPINRIVIVMNGKIEEEATEKIIRENW